MGYVDDVIQPQDTRRMLEKVLEAHLTFQSGQKKTRHGNIPL